MARSNIALAVTALEIRERPILFSSAMVQAILVGKKSMTRRVVSIANSLVNGDSPSKRSNGLSGWPDLDFSKAWVDSGPSPAGNPGPYLKVPGVDESVQRVYSRVQVGDRLWVKETFVSGCGLAECKPGHWLSRPDAYSPAFIYAADRAVLPTGVHWKPSIFMPRGASRITLEVTAVRPERVQEISEEDAKAEGTTLPVCSYAGRCNSNRCPLHSSTPYRNGFESLWQSINGKRPGCSWPGNPWVNVIEFKVVK